MNNCNDQFDYCDDDMNEHVLVTEIPALKSPRQDDYSSRSQLKQISLTYRTNKVNPIKEKVQNYVDKKDKKLQNIRDQLQNKLMSQCTFKPQTNKSTYKRNLNQFLQSQDQHLSKVQQKKTKLKKQLQEKSQQTFKPKINTKNKTNPVPAHERLYHKKQFEPDNYQQFQPQIHKKSKNIARNIPVEQLLYKDALRRTGKQKNAVLKEKGLSVRNNKTQKLVAQKFIKQFYYTLEDLNLLQIKQISFDEFKSIFRYLGFLTYEEDSQSDLAEEERILSDQAYFVIEEFGINPRNVCVLLMAIMGVFNINPIHFGSQCDEKKKFEVDEIDGRKIQRHFDLFYRNRLSNQSKIKKQSHYKTEQYSHHPQINCLSTQMAERYRQKMINKANKRFEANNLNIILSDKNTLTHEDLLVIDNMGKNLQLSQLKQQKQKRMDKQCTFHPKINNHEKSVDGKTGLQKSLQLYEYAQVKKERQRQNLYQQKMQNIEKNKSKSQKGKSPLNKPSQKMNESNNLSYVKSIDKTLARMYEGRKIREEKNKYLQRGQPQNNKFKGISQLPSQRSQQPPVQQKKPEPYIVIDVNMQDQIEQIQFYTGDEKNIDRIVSQFCQKHSLDEENKEQLFQMVQRQIYVYLNNVGVDSTNDLGN